MSKIQYALLVIFLSAFSGQLLAQKEVIGYYQSWKWQEFPERLDPQNIPYDKLTIINYSFFYPLESGEIVGMDPVADNFLLKGEKNPRSSLIDQAARHGTKVVLSIGGWETSNNFPQVSADPQKRANFAHCCVKLIREYGFDGIDIDWEFPGYKRHNGTDQDRFNFTFLLQTVRDSLEMLGAKSSKKYLLSASLPAAASHLPDIEVRKITPVLDYLNIMTYDLYGSWGKISNHNSALYGPAQGDAARCLDGAFKLYHEEHGVPAEKITLTAVCFGYSYASCPDIYSEHQGADTLLFNKGQDILYADIAEKSELFERHWDSQAQAPYLISKSQTLISLDDPESVALKADYIIKNNAAGLTVWPLMGDYLENGESPLLDVIHKKFSSEEYYSVEDFKSVKKFDSHIHINTDQTAFMDLARDDNFQFLDIVDDRPFGLSMDEQQKFAFSHLEKFPDRMILATTFKVKGWNDPGWIKKTIAALQKSIAKGAKAVKIWKNIGMDLKDENGKFVMVDNAQLDPILDYLEKNNITLVGHNGEPRDCWLPIEEMTFNQGYYGSHPEYHMYLHPEYPSYDDQINARDNMLVKHPHIKFIGAHLGSLEWSLDELAKRLDRFPNMRVDLSRMSNLMLHTLRDRQKTRDFFIKYQDRLIYATDTAINPSNDPTAMTQNIHDRWLDEWKFYVTDDEILLKGHGKLRGLKLPVNVIDKIYLKNALNIFGKN